jgi:hypothetical protein
MLGLPSPGASRYHNYGTSPEYFGYTLVLQPVRICSSAQLKKISHFGVDRELLPALTSVKYPQKVKYKLLTICASVVTLFMKAVSGK